MANPTDSALARVAQKRTRDEIIGRMILGRYRIVRRLARGGMGVVYLARAEGAAGFVKPVVVKRILPDLTGDDKMAKMFVREARIMSRLRHPNIVSVVEFAEDNDAYVMVLEYVHGYHLGRWVKYTRTQEGQVPPELVLHIVAKVLDALHHAHTLRGPDGEIYQVVHRDVSPSNVHLSAEGHVKLIDFGIARASRESGEYQTEEISLKGKLPYMAPEMFKTGTPSPKTDLYACGVMLHELLRGINEFRGKEMSETVNLVLHHTPTPLEPQNPQLPKGIDAVIQKAVAKEADDRFADAATFAAALRELRGLNENDADAMLAARLAQDFDGRLSKSLGVYDLGELDRAWREPPDPVAMSLIPSSDVADTDVDLPNKGIRAEATKHVRQRRMLVGAVIAFALLAAGGVGFGIIGSGEKPSTPKFTVETKTATQPANDTNSDPTTNDDGAGGSAESPSDDSLLKIFERTIMANAKKLTKCQPMAGNYSGKELQLQFTIAPDGSVAEAKLTPEQAPAKLRSCLESAATTLKFKIPKGTDTIKYTQPLTL